MSNNSSSTVQSVFNTTTSTILDLLNETTTTTTQTVPDYKIRRANFIWPEDPVDEIPMK